MTLGYTVLVLVVYALAVARLTRLINADTIFDRPRLWIARNARRAQAVMDDQIDAGAHPDIVEQWRKRTVRWNTAHYFVACPWCVGMWLSLLTAWAPVWAVSGAWWAVLPVALATSHLIGVCARFADTEDVSIEGDDS